MNWAAWGPTIVAIVTAIFIAGQVTGRIKDQEKTLVKHNQRLDEHDDDIVKLSERQSRSEAWREGYSAGRSKAGQQQ